MGFHPVAVLERELETDSPCPQTDSIYWRLVKYSGSTGDYVAFSLEGIVRDSGT